MRIELQSPGFPPGAPFPAVPALSFLWKIVPWCGCLNFCCVMCRRGGLCSTVGAPTRNASVPSDLTFAACRPRTSVPNRADLRWARSCLMILSVQ